MRAAQRRAEDGEEAEVRGVGCEVVENEAAGCLRSMSVVQEGRAGGDADADVDADAGAGDLGASRAAAAVEAGLGHSAALPGGPRYAQLGHPIWGSAGLSRGRRLRCSMSVELSNWPAYATFNAYHCRVSDGNLESRLRRRHRQQAGPSASPTPSSQQPSPLSRVVR